MIKGKNIAALFDFDGVTADTETQYSLFWNAIGKEYHPEIECFGRTIKGQTLMQILEKHFSEFEGAIPALIARHDEFEDNMKFEYIPGLQDFVRDLRAHGVKVAIVTSSDQKKMAKARAALTDLDELADRVITAEMFSRSKPAPDCFLLGAEVFGTVPENCVVFEDSLHGLGAGCAAGMKVVGLSTTFPEETIKGKCDIVIPDFTGFTYEKMMALLA